MRNSTRPVRSISERTGPSTALARYKDHGVQSGGFLENSLDACASFDCLAAAVQRPFIATYAYILAWMKSSAPAEYAGEQLSIYPHGEADRKYPQNYPRGMAAGIEIASVHVEAPNIACNAMEGRQALPGLREAFKAEMNYVTW